MSDLHARLQGIVLGTPWLLEVLRVVRDVGPSEAYVGAGVVRDVVWNVLHDANSASPTADVDVVFFAPQAAPANWSQRLDNALPGFRWDVTNQAEVHQWQSRELRRPVAPYESLDAAISAWPETATAVAVRLGEKDTFAVVAPYGLGDLFGLQLRPAPALVDRSAYLSRLRTKRWRARWPRLTIHPPSDSR